MMMGWDEIVSEKEVREESSAQIRAEQSIEEKRREESGGALSSLLGE